MRLMSLLDPSGGPARPGLACVLLLTALIVVGISCGTGEAPQADEKEPASAAEGFVPVNGDGKLYYQVRGEGHPVVLIHGGSTHVGMWDDQFDVLARHFKVVRYDVRGFGRSSSSQVGHSQWHDLRKLLEHLGIERTHIVGLSLGGRIAVDFALEDPEKVAHLVLAGPGLSGWQFEPAEWINEVRAAKEAGDKRAATEAWLRSPYLTAIMEDPELAERIRQISYDTEHSWVQNLRAVQLTPPAVERLSELKAPALLILGSRDANDAHRIVDFIAGNAPNAQTIIVEGAGHMVNMERPEEFNRAVLDFLPR